MMTHSPILLLLILTRGKGREKPLFLNLSVMTKDGGENELSLSWEYVMIETVHDCQESLFN